MADGDDPNNDPVVVDLVDGPALTTTSRATALKMVL